MRNLYREIYKDFAFFMPKIIGFLNTKILLNMKILLDMKIPLYMIVLLEYDNTSGADIITAHYINPDSGIIICLHINFHDFVFVFPDKTFVFVRIT